MYISRNGKTRPPYSLRHYYATQRLLDGVQVYDLAKNMGTSVDKIEKHYGHILSVQKTDELIQGASISSSQKSENITNKNIKHSYVEILQMIQKAERGSLKK